MRLINKDANEYESNGETQRAKIGRAFTASLIFPQRITAFQTPSLLTNQEASSNFDGKKLNWSLIT